MATVKINNKSYVVPEFNFRHSKMMEQMGLPVEGMMSRRYVFTIASAFTAIVVGCDIEQADHLIEQHILGGGNLEGIFDAYARALNESAFFKKLLELDEAEEKAKKNTKRSQSQKTEQKSSENVEE